MNKIKILIVDDVSQTRKDMTRLLYFEDDMAVVGEAGNGVEALQKIAEVQPDVILMDINMPQMDGIAATERVSQLYPNVAVVIISIQGESEYLKKAMFAGARDYLVKPLGSDEMASAIRSVYKQHRLRTAHLTQYNQKLPEVSENSYNVLKPPGIEQNLKASMQQTQVQTEYMAVEEIDHNVRRDNRQFQQTQQPQQPWEQTREVSAAVQEDPALHREFTRLDGEHQAIPSGYAGNGNMKNGETAPHPEPEPENHEITQTEFTEPVQLKQRVETGPGAEKEETEPHFTPVVAVPKIPSDEKPLGMLSVVFCGKGGVGKTTLATNLAVVLSQHEKKKVALVDLDLQFGDIAVMLNLSESKTISDLVREYDDISGEALANCMIRHFTGIDILPAPMFPQDAEYVNTEHIEKVLTLLKQTYDYIIVDTAANFYDINLQAMDMAEQILIVVTRDIATIKNVKTGLNILNSLGYRDRVRLVLNRADQDLGVDISDLEKGVEMAVAHQICSDERTVVSAINKGVPVMVSHSTSEISRSIRRMGERIVMGKRLPAQEKAGKTLINRIFSL